MAHLQVLISVLSLFGLAHLLKMACPSPSGASFFHAAVWTSLILYVGALGSLLPQTALALRIVGGIGFLLLLRQMLQKKPCLTPEVGFLTFSLITFYLLCQTSYFQTFSQVDDFVYWGRMSRYLADDNALLRQLAPIAALFQYFFTHFAGFEDRLAIFAQSVLIISGLALAIRPLARYTGAAKKITCCFAVLVAYSLVWILFTGLGTLQVDLLLGISYGVALLTYYCRELNNKEFILWEILPISLFIVLLKPIGILFALLAVGVVGLDYVRKGSRSLGYRFGIILLALFAIFICYASMKGYLQRLNLVGFSVTFTANDVIDALDPNSASTKQALIIKNFVSYIFLALHPSTYWFAVCIVSVLAIFKISKISHVPFSITPYLAMFAGFVAYTLVLLLTYMFVFSEYEGISLASLERYAITYLLGMVIVFMGRLLVLGANGLASRPAKVWLISIAFLYFFPNAVYFARHMARIIGNPSHFYVHTVANIATDVVKVTPSNSKIYFVHSRGTNDEGEVFNYLIMPRDSNRTCSFIRPPEAPRSEVEPWSCALSLEEFKTKVSQYDFVAFAKTSNEFIHHYLKPMQIHAITQERIYSVSNANGTVKLKPVAVQ
jgi:hypothetical protein